MSILRSTSVLWFQFILVIIACCDNTAAQSAEEFIIDCEKPLDNQIRRFPPTSPAIQLQSRLEYSEKPLWPLQWYMNEEILTVKKYEYFPSMYIAKMHENGIKGDGIGVVIIGNSPVNCQHVAIKGRCHAKDSSTSLSKYPGKSLVYLFRKKYRLPAPSGVSSGIAGIIGMSDDGVIGGVGIAPKCHIGSVVIQPSASQGSPEYCAAKIIARNTSPPAELFVHAWVLPYLDYERSILHALDDISLLNFGDPRIVLKPHVMTGSKYGVRSNSCQCNEYASADSMFLFGQVEYSGYLSLMSESCASLFGVVYSDCFGKKLYENVVTIDSENLTSFCCAKNHYLDTNPAVGIAGGVIALIIDCFKRKFNRPPSVSDLAFLLAFSLSSEALQDTNILWFTNGIGLIYSLQAGFGVPDMINVESLVDIWTPINFPIIYKVDRFTREIEFQCSHDDRKKTLTYLSNLVCNFHISNAQAHLHIQLVTVQLSAKLVNRGALTVYLISPAGTVSCILEGRPYDTDKNQYKKLRLRSNHFIGEQLGGQWSIRFYTYQENSNSFYSEDILPAMPSDDANKPTDSGGNDHASSSSSLVNTKPGSAEFSSNENVPRPISIAKKREPNAVNLNEIKFRFVLHKRLPAKLNLEPQVKSDAEVEKNLELLKAWVDFRHFVFAKVDPKKENIFLPEFERPAVILRRHVRQLIMLQKNENFDPERSQMLIVNEPTQ